MPSLDELWGLFIVYAGGFALGRTSGQASTAQASMAERDELRRELVKVLAELNRAQAEPSVLRVALSETAAELTQVKAERDELRGELAKASRANTTPEQGAPRFEHPEPEEE